MGRIVINETENKQTVILNDSPEGVEGGYFDEAMEWHELRGGTSGEWTSDGIAQNLEPSGDIVLSEEVTLLSKFAFAGKPITSIKAPGVKQFENQYVLADTHIENIDDDSFPSIGQSAAVTLFLRLGAYTKYIKLSGEYISLASGSSALRDNHALVKAEFPNAAKSVPASAKNTGVYFLASCENLELADIGHVTSVAANSFNGDTKLATLIIRKEDAVASLGNINAFTNTPFASGKAGGTLYVPQALISSYQSATNWSTILGYASNQIKAIEGSEYEL